MASKTSIKKAAKELKDVAAYVTNHTELADGYRKRRDLNACLYHLDLCKRALEWVDDYATAINEEIDGYAKERVGVNI